MDQAPYKSEHLEIENSTTKLPELSTTRIQHNRDSSNLASYVKEHKRNTSIFTDRRTLPTYDSNPYIHNTSIS